jgi:hypothetical protein
VITPRAKSLLTLRATFLARYIKHVTRVIKENIYNASSNALKNLSREGDYQRKNLIKVES